MLNFINSIPESIGWAIVGVVGVAVLVVCSVLIKWGADYLKSRKEED